MAAEPEMEERMLNFFKQEKYRSLLATAAAQRRQSILVDHSDLISFDEELSHLIVNDPLKYLPILDRSAYKQLQVEDPDYAAALKEFKARVFNLPDRIPIREIRSHHLGKLIAVDGIMVRASTVRPMLKTAVFACFTCGAKYFSSEDSSAPRLRTPERCERCRGRKFEMIPEESEYMDFQLVGIQEKPEDLPPGQIPRVIDVELKGDIVDLARPGDRVIVTGVLRTMPERDANTPRRMSKMYLEAVSIETASKEPESLIITPEEEKLFREMARDPEIHRKLVESIAPSLYGLEHVKKAIMLLLFGGTPKQYPDGTKIRGDIHLLLVGDPGTGKSQLLKYVAMMAPRGIYTSGRGSTAAGLTAAVVRDSSGGMMLEAGALVLADMGVACIDEIDKMRPEDRVALHEAMAQQTISIAKGGIVATLNARTSILAAANPTLGRYDPYRSFTDNVDLPITILSRFDLIFVLRDEPNRDLDERLTDHVLGLQSRSVAVTSPPIKPEILRKYIAYGRRIRPELTPAAARLIKEFYLQMRSMYQQTSTVTITARQLESLIRLAEARARAALRDYVTEEDVLDVIDLMKRSLSEVGIDIETGRPDIDVILTGKPKSLRDKIAVFLDTLKKLQEEKGHAEDEELREALREKGFTDAEISKILGRLLSEGKIFSPRTGIYRIT